MLATGFEGPLFRVSVQIERLHGLVQDVFDAATELEVGLGVALKFVEVFRWCRYYRCQ